MTTPRKKLSIILTAVAAAALLWGTMADAAMPTPQRKPAAHAGHATPSKKPKAAAAKPKPAAPATTTAQPPSGTPTTDIVAEEKPPAPDVDESLPFPDYPKGARIATGEMKTYMVGEEDTFLDIARNFSLGYVELRAANPDVDPWAPMPGSALVIPTFKLLPRARQEGILVNLAEMRLYYFRGAGTAPLSFPLGIGSEGLETPTGETTVTRKVAGPSWFPTERMKKLKPWLPNSVSAGGSNPLGTHALYLGFPEVLIHGSNKPWGIGRRVSSGCMRMYPEDIISMFGMTPVGTRVTIVNQPIKIGWVHDNLYLEANPSMSQSNEIEIEGKHSIKGMADGLKKNIIAVAGDAADRIDWSTVQKVVKERRGYPVLIATLKPVTSDSLSPHNPSDYN